MSDAGPSTSSGIHSPGCGRSRGKSRGGLGKYLRARGRGHSFGRPAEFTKRLVLEGEEPQEIDPEEAEANNQRYSRRQLVSNADRYAEEEPQLDSDGEEIKEPEIDLSAFLEKQRLSEANSAPALYGAFDKREEDEEEIDHSLAHITSQRQPAWQSKKGRVQTIEWDASLEQMRREKAAAEAHRDLKERFRAKTNTLRSKPMALKERQKENDIVQAPLLPTEDVTRKDPKSEMQDFLDDLLG